MAEATVLEQTKSQFTIKGIVDGLTKDNAYREGVVAQGKNQGKAYRSIRFFVQTSKENKIAVELFGMELDYVYPYKKGKKGQKGESRKTEFSKRNNLPEGFHIIGVNVGLEQNEAGKNIRDSLVDYDAVEYIWENLNDGDSINVSGEVVFSQYENNNGDKVDQIKYIIKNIYKEKDIDFEDEKFVEVAAFEQEIVFVDATYDDEEDATYIDAYTIQYGNKFTSARFAIRPNGNAAIDKVAKAFASKLKFGDFVQVFGLALNKAETIVVEDEAEEVEEDDIFGGGGEKPEGLDRRAVTHYVTELRVTGTGKGTFVQGKYEVEDFEVEDEELVSNDDVDPFSEDDGEEGMLDIDSDDLPF